MENQIEIIARGILLRGSAVLLCQNVRRGYWYLPGGHVEFNESTRAALARELQEECGVAIDVNDCVLVTEGYFAAKRPHHEINFVFQLIADPDVVVQSHEEGVHFAWHDLAAVPDLDLRPAGIKAWLASGGRLEAGSGAWLSEMAEKPIQS